MSPAMVQALISATIRALDLIDRFNSSFDSQEELNNYIAERDAVRNELVQLSRQLGQSEPEPGPERAGDNLDHGYRPSGEEDSSSESTTDSQS